MPKADVSQPFRLRETSQVRDRDARQAEDGLDAIEFQGVDHKMKPVGGGGRTHFIPHVETPFNFENISGQCAPRTMLGRALIPICAMACTAGRLSGPQTLLSPSILAICSLL